MTFLKYLCATVLFPIYMVLMLVVGIGIGFIKGWQLTCKVFETIVGNEDCLL